MTTVIHDPHVRDQTVPYFRAYSHIVNEFVPFGILTTSNEFFTKDLEGKSIKVDGVEIDFFLGKYCEDGSPIYENDVVDVATPNEFGSATIDSCVVRFDPVHLAYFLESRTTDSDDMLPLPTKIVRVTGHDHGPK